MNGSNSQPELRDRFWELPLDELNEAEWEALCDGCGRCCLKKFLDEESGEIAWTRVICRYFDSTNCRCSEYHQRRSLVPDCLQVRQMDLANSKWVPASCAYRLRFEGKPLYDWHPLLAGSDEAIRASGISVADKVLSEEHVHERGYVEHVIRWVHS